MHNYIKSIGYALTGLLHAFRTERNFRLFVFGYSASLVLALLFRVDLDRLPIIILSGGAFLAIELINTALEHFADAFDDHTKKQEDLRYSTIKCTKDVAAGAALVSAVAWALTLFIIFWPYIRVTAERIMLQH